MIEVSAAFAHSAAVDEAGGLWTWGSSQWGKLGHKCRGRIEQDESHKIRQPKQVATLASQRVRHVSACNETTFAVTASGRLYGWGLADMGVLGIGEEDVCEHGEWTPRHVVALEGTPVRQVSSDVPGHSVVLTEAGEVYTMGEWEWVEEPDDMFGQPEFHHITTQWVPTLVNALLPPCGPVVEVLATQEGAMMRTAGGKMFRFNAELSYNRFR